MNKSVHLNSKKLRIVAISVIFGATVFTASVNVFASLNATATVNHDVAVGTLKLSQSALSGSAGLSQTISNMAPGDVVNRYVTLLNGGSLEAKDLGLAIAATGTGTLITDGVGNKALTVAVNSCSGTWNTSTGACSGGTISNEVAATPLNSFTSKQNFAVSKVLAATSGTVNLQIQVTLPDQNETTVNGVAPAVTVQNGLVTLNYTFSESQRLASASNS